jgi:hypothetical protein
MNGVSVVVQYPYLGPEDNVTAHGADEFSVFRNSMFGLKVPCLSVLKSLASRRFRSMRRGPSYEPYAFTGTVTVPAFGRV